MTAASPAPHPVSPPELSRIAQDLQIRKTQVEAALHLLDEGNTIPFITRYRREQTGGLSEDALRQIQDRVGAIRALADRKQTILKSIESQGKLSDELKEAILAAENPRRLDDLYFPYKPKKKPWAADAREKGLEPLALAVWNRDPAVANLDEIIAGMLDPEKQLASADDVRGGALKILAEIIAETADLRTLLRRALWDTASLTAKRHEKLPEGKGQEYKEYFQFAEPAARVPAHRILAINRGERENALSVKFDHDPELIGKVAVEALPNLADHPHRELLLAALNEAVTKLVVPSIDREMKRELSDFAQGHATHIYMRNLRNLLLQPPMRGRRVLAIDPGFRTGCKLAVLDEAGGLIELAVIHPHAPQKRLAEAYKTMERLVRVHQTSVIAIGNGTASRETEEIVSNLIARLDAIRRGENPPPIVPDAPPPVPKVEQVPTESPAGAGTTAEQPAAVPAQPVAEASPATSEASPVDSPPPLPPTVEVTPEPEAATVKAESPPAAAPVEPEAAKAEAPAAPEVPLPVPPADVAYVVVNEAGASEYSTSPAAREEFPSLDAAARAAVSIGRRLQDPLTELVKADPQHVAAALFHHDLHSKQLRGFLDAVVESCINHVGVDLNTAGEALLRHVAGFNQLVSNEIVEYRKANGPFRRLEQLALLPSIGPARFAQAAGFLNIRDGEEPLDNTWVHPESYDAARRILQELGCAAEDLRDAGKLEALREKCREAKVEELASKLQLSPPAVYDILDALARPGRDPRDEHPAPVFRRAVLRIEDLSPGVELRGTVLNVVDFGVFVDVGLKDSGLVHISQMANRFIRNPYEVASVGDVVKVWVIAVDMERRRVSLTMIAPGTERKPEPKAEQPRRSAQPPREPRPPRPDGQPPQERGPRPPRQSRGQDHRRRPPRQQPVAEGQSTDSATEAAPPHRRTMERRPPKPKPLPTLTQEKREGKAYLNTLGELEAFFKARETPPGEEGNKPSGE